MADAFRARRGYSGALPRLVLPLIVALFAAAVVAATAGASARASRPAGSPDLAAMALAVQDLPRGTKVEKQGYVRDPDFVATYEREFRIPSTRLGGSTLMGVVAGLAVERTPTDARATFGALARLLRGKRGATFVKTALVGEGLDPAGIAVGKLRRPAIGHGALAIPVRITVRRLTFQTTLFFVRFDRVLGTLVVVGRKLRATDMDRLARVAVDRVRAGLVPAARTAPTLSGLAEPGQMLTATRGTWAGDQLTFAYQWERCDPAGASCAAIPGATGTTYTLETGDLASTVRFTVAARNRLGGVSRSSSATAVVTGPPGSPANTSVPEIAGTPQVGETLTATTGTWTGDPAVFTYQWRRCDASGGACVDVEGATEATYAVTPGDSRATLRVLVVATNAAGPGGAISAPTAAIP